MNGHTQTSRWAMGIDNRDDDDDDDDEEEEDDADDDNNDDDNNDDDKMMICFCVCVYVIRYSTSRDPRYIMPLLAHSNPRKRVATVRE